MDLSRLLSPASIAVIGGKEAAEVIRQCRRMGYSGEIWPVHPRHETVEGIPCFKDVSDLPSAPDAAFIGVRRDLTIGIVRELAAMGAGGAICYASGFRESGGDGNALQAALVEASGDMPILGPNCYGMINYLDGALLWPDQHGGKRVERGVALITQSSNIAINLTMNRRGVPIAFVMTMGNQAKVGVPEAIEALVDDPRVTAIGLHIEGIGDMAAFDRAALRARAAGKPVVAMKTGRSEAGAELTMSHTASLAGSDRLIDACFKRQGIARVHSLTALMETVKLLHTVGPLSGHDLASMSCSGGEASVMADTAEGRHIRFRPFDSADIARIRPTVTDLVTVSNPFDYHTFAWAKPDEMAAIFAAVMEGEIDLTMLVLDFPRADRCSTDDWDKAIEGLTIARDRTGGKAAIVATFPECMPESTAENLVEAGIVPLFGVEDALTAAEAAAFIGECLAKPLPEPLDVRATPDAPRTALSEAEAKVLLSDYGLNIPEARIADSADAAVRAAMEIGTPVVVKATGRNIAHKSELGAVALNLREPEAVRTAAALMEGMGEGILVERMVEDAVAEVIVGVDRDPAIGPYVVLGSGGVLVELVGDSAVIPLPTNAAAVREALASLKVHKLMQGFRGKPAGDVDAVIEAVLAVARFTADHADRIAELDINPLMVRPEGKGAVTADALIRLFDNR